MIQKFKGVFKTFVGNLGTYWLKGREARISLSKLHSKGIIWSPPAPAVRETRDRPHPPKTVKKVDSRDDGEDLLAVVDAVSASGNFLCCSAIQVDKLADSFG